MRAHRLLLAVFFFAIPLSVSAQVLTITPALVDSSEPVEQALAKNKGRASTSIQGKGGYLQIIYTASEPLLVFMVPVAEDGRFVPTDFLRFTLPETEEGMVEIDLTVSPGWSPSEKKWILHLLTETQEAEAGFQNLAIVPASFVQSVGAGIGHFFAPEPYTPSSYHALRGYRVFGIQVTMVLGALAVLAGLAVLFLPLKKLPALVVVLLGFHFLYGLRFGMDLLRFTGEHLTGYAKQNYDEAGSVHTVAEVLKVTSRPNSSVYVCRDGTNYKEKLLRYFAYPLTISAEPATSGAADFALVMGKSHGDWALVTETVDQRTRQILKCNDVYRPAELLSTFADGSSLYKLLPS